MLKVDLPQLLPAGLHFRICLQQGDCDLGCTVGCTSASPRVYHTSSTTQILVGLTGCIIDGTQQKTGQGPHMRSKHLLTRPP